MFANWLLIGLAQVLPIVVPFGKPPARVEAPIAPIESSGPAFAGTCKDWDDYNKPAPPVRIHGNTYLVGTCGISSILIVGKQGDILIDGGTGEDADLIAANIRRVGAKLTDIKYLLHSHEHFDHVGGLAKLQRMTGAELLASAPAAAVLNSGTARGDDPQAGINPPFEPAHVDRIIRDGEQVRLGDIVLTAVATPGHTAGALSWHWGSCDGGVCRQIVYADSLTPVSRDDYRFTDHPDVVAGFRASIAKVAALDCEILLTPHPSASHMLQRLAPGQPLFDPDGCKTYAAERTKALDERLAKEAAGEKPGVDHSQAN
jgi:metallo-beta-lactamase class B